MPGLTHLVMYVTPAMCEQSTLTAAQKYAARLTLNDPLAADSDAEPVLLPSQVHRKVFMNVTLGALSGQAGTMQGCPSILQFKNFPEIVRQLILFCARYELSKTRRPDPDLIILLSNRLSITTEFGPAVFRRFLDSILHWIDNNLTPERKPSVLTFVEEKIVWKSHTKHWTSDTTLAQIAEQDSTDVRSVKPALVNCGLKVLMDRVIAQLAETCVWDSPCPPPTPVLLVSPAPHSQVLPAPHSQVPPAPHSQVPAPLPSDRSTIPAAEHPQQGAKYDTHPRNGLATSSPLSSRSMRSAPPAAAEHPHHHHHDAAAAVTKDSSKVLEDLRTNLKEMCKDYLLRIRGDISTINTDLKFLRHDMVANTTTVKHDLSHLRRDMDTFNGDLSYLCSDLRKVTQACNGLAYMIDGSEPDSGKPKKDSVMSRLWLLEKEKMANSWMQVK